MASPKKIPTKLKLIRGTLKKSRTLPSEMQGTYLVDIPPAPETLREKGKSIWEKTGQSLVRQGILLNEDLLLFESYCNLADYLEELKMKLRDEKLIYKLQNREKQPYYLKNKTLELYLGCLKAFISVASEFGLSPSARASIPAAGKPDKKKNFDLEMFGN